MAMEFSNPATHEMYELMKLAGAADEYPFCPRCGSVDGSITLDESAFRCRVCDSAIPFCCGALSWQCNHSVEMSRDASPWKKAPRKGAQ